MEGGFFFNLLVMNSSVFIFGALGKIKHGMKIFTTHKEQTLQKKRLKNKNSQKFYRDLNPHQTVIIIFLLASQDKGTST